MISFTRTRLGLAAWALCLALELEVLLVQHYEVRTQLRDLFGLPLYHILLTFLALVAIVKFFAIHPGRLLSRVAWRWPWLACHLVLYLGLYRSFERWWWASQSQGPGLVLLLWTVIGWLLLGSWLLAWLPWSVWWKTLREEGEWLRWVLPVSFAAPYLSEAVSGRWSSFAAQTFQLAYFGLNIFYAEVVCDPETLQLGTPDFVIEILPGCSGYEGMGLLGLLVSAYLWVRRDHLRFPRSLILIPLGVLLAYLANVLRLVVLIVIGTEVSESIALRGFHSQAGWMSFTVLGLALIALVESIPWFHRGDQPIIHDVQEYSYPALPYLMPMAALLLGTMVVQASTGKFAYSYPLKPLLGGVLLGNYLSYYRLHLGRPAAVSALVGLAVWILWFWLVPAAPAVSPYTALAYPWAQAWIALRMLGGVLVVPISEELAFRGYLMRRLQGEQFESFSGPTSWKALLLSSLAFGCLHQEWLAGTCAGLAYGWVATRRGGISNAIVAHMLTNLILAIQAVALKQWGLW